VGRAKSSTTGRARAQPRTDYVLRAGVFAVASAIFIADTVTHLPVAVAILYVAVVLLAARIWQERGVILAALGCGALTLGSWLSAPAEMEVVSLVNTGISIAAIGLTCLLTLQSQSADRRSREQASLLDLTHDTIFVRRMDNVITYWNHGAETLYGWSREEAVGKVTHELMRTVFPEPLEGITAELLRTGYWQGELIHTTRDGTEVVVASRWSLSTDEYGQPGIILETNNDVTERKRAEELLRESERRYRNIFETAGVSIWEEDFTRVREATENLKSQGVRDLRAYLAAHPDFVQNAIAMVDILDVNRATLDLVGAKSKEELLGSLRQVLAPETYEAFADELVAIFEGREHFQSETVIQKLDGQKRNVLFTITFPPHPAGLESVLVTFMDVTEAKRAERALRDVQMELAHVNRVATMGQLTASIAHEVRQPIAAIVTKAQAAGRWLRAESPDLEEACDAIDRVIANGGRAADVVSRIRALVVKAGARKDVLDLNGAIAEVIALTRGEMVRSSVFLKAHLSQDLPEIVGDRIQLQQVVLNLVVNAIDAMSGIDPQARELQITTEVDADGDIVVSVRDSGPGLDTSQADRVFEAFYTTKPDGMGMGLAICRSIIETHGGSLWAGVNEPRGAVFQFMLPRDRGEAARTSLAAKSS
jgi:PAS domain S-box-containing protein